MASKRRTKAEIEAAKKRSYQQWAYRLKQTYGLTPDEYFNIKEAQGGSCYVCRTAKGVTVRLAVDHSHSEGFIRGELDRRCNSTLGMYGDDPEVFDRFAEYLRNPPAFNVIGVRKVPNHVAGQCDT